MAKKSEYKSNKSVAKNPTVPISVDDPRLAWNKAQQTKSRQGAEVDMVGIDGKSLIQGGSNLSTPNGGVRSDSNRSPEVIVIPPTNGNPGYAIEGFDAIVPTDISNVQAVWSGEDLVVTFDWDYEDPLNNSVSEFILEVTADGITRQTPYGSFPVNRTQVGQTATLTKSLNRSTIGIFRTSITSVCVYAIDSFYNKSNSVCDTSIPAYVLNLPIPVITVTAATNGYNVAYTLPTESVFDAIDIVEYESTSSTEPTGVDYSRVYFNSISPANIITVNTNQRWVKARFSSDSGVYTAFSAAQKVTPLSPVTVDTTGPSAPTGTVTGGIESSGTIGFNAFLNVSWTAVSDSTLRGYRIRFRPVTTPTASDYSYVDSPGNASAGSEIKYRITGLASGTSYEVQIASYDEFNNTSSSYSTLTNSPISTGGVPFIGENVSTTGYFEAGVSGTDTGVFRFGYGVETGKRGLVFNPNNYWYIDSSQSASLKVGGPDNYVTWNGSSLVVAGDLQAKKGSFSGNVNIATGASIFSGTLTGNTITDSANTGGSLSGAGYILNEDGITFSNGLSGSSLRQTTIAGASGLLTTNSANIGGWTINSTEIKRSATGQGTLSLNSSLGYISVSSDNVANTLAGINSATFATDTTFWSGGTGPLDFDSSFRVDLSGKLFARNADISGKIEAESGYIGTAADGWNINTNGITAVGAGRIKLGNYSMQSLNGTDFGIYDISTLENQGRRQTLIRTETIPQATDPGRIYIGDPRRQVEVAKSAQVSGDGSSVELDSFTDSDAPTINAYRSGGLRNMFTANLSALNAATQVDGTIDLYPSAIKGDVLIVYEVNNPNNLDTNPWRKINSIYLNTKGVSGLTYYYAGYSEYNGVCLSAPGADGTTYETLNLPTGITIQPGTTLTQVFANNSSSGEVVWGVYSTLNFEEAINKLNEHATSRDSACAPGQFTVPNFVGLPQPPSTDQYNIVLGDNEPTNSPVLFGTVFAQNPAAGSQADEGIDIIINMYVASTIPQFEVPDFVGLAQPPSTDDYNIVLGPSVITNSPTLAGTVQGQNVLAYSFQNVGIDITIYMYVLATPTTFTVPNFVGGAQPPSTSDYTIALGPDTTTSSPSLFGTVATQDKEAGSSQPIGTTITISMYVAAPTPPPPPPVLPPQLPPPPPPVIPPPPPPTLPPPPPPVLPPQLPPPPPVAPPVLPPQLPPPVTPPVAPPVAPPTAPPTLPPPPPVAPPTAPPPPPPTLPPPPPVKPPTAPPTLPPPVKPPPVKPPPSFSDARDKTNVEALTLGLDFVNKLNPTTYTWNMRDGSVVDVDDFGFLAQDLVALEDSVDGHDRLRLTHRENPDKLMISQDRLIPILVKAIQDLSKQIEDLKKN